MSASSWAPSSSSRCPSWPCRRCTTSQWIWSPIKARGSWSTPCTERVKAGAAERRDPGRASAQRSTPHIPSHRRLRRESNRDRRTRRPSRSYPREPRDAMVSFGSRRSAAHQTCGAARRVQGWFCTNRGAAEGRYARRRRVIRFSRGTRRRRPSPPPRTPRRRARTRRRARGCRDLRRRPPPGGATRAPSSSPPP